MELGYWRLLLIFTLAFVLGACSPATHRQGSSPIPQEVTLTEEDDGSTVELGVGSTLEIVLPGNPTTGYSWEVASEETLVLMQIGEASFEPESGALGAGGKLSLRFVAMASGETVLRLVYRRPFEEDAPAARSFEVTVKVA